MTARNQQIVERYLEGFSLTEVGEEFGITRERVRQILLTKGITQRHGGTKRREAHETQIQAAYQQVLEGKSAKDVAEIFGLTPESLRDNLRRRGLPIPKPEPRHGTRYYYMKYECRCELCKEAVRAHTASLKGQEPPQHGTHSAYHNYACRCAPCKAAGRDLRRQQKIRRLERLTTSNHP